LGENTVIEPIETKYADAAYAPTDTERSAFAHISARKGEDPDAVLPRDASFGVFFHLSPMRASILNWYPFDPAGVALERGGDMGAVTGLLCARCARVVSLERKTFKAKAILSRHGVRDNLTVIAGDVSALSEPGGHALPRAFDYVVALDPENFTLDRLKGLFDLLSPHGRLLLAAENRFALRYWCGKSSPETGLPFDGLKGGDGLLSREELSRRLAAAGFGGQKWYYPLPDHWFAREIYSEAHPPNRFLNTRFVPYVKADCALRLREQDLYEDVIAGGAFEFMCNAYLVEARKCAGDPPCDVDYAALTTYRTKDKRFATTMHADGTVRKTALRAEGVRRLEGLAKNHAALGARGISVVPVTLSGRAAVMSRVAHETLWDHWQGLFREGNLGANDMIPMFDRLRDAIMASSECEPPGARGWDPRLGPVQKTAYPELVPANCFYDPERDALTFFDQECARTHCPANVPLSRALLSLRYAPVFSSDDRMSALLPALIERYGLTDCWDLLEKEENDFLKSVFNFEAIAPLNAETAKADDVVGRNEVEIRYGKVANALTRRGRRIGVYGYGRRGRRLCAHLRLTGAEIAFLIDRNIAALTNADPNMFRTELFSDVAAVSSAAARCDVIAVTPKAGADAIAAALREKVDCPVVTFDELAGRGS
jgi:hypothetical protein